MKIKIRRKRKSSPRRPDLFTGDVEAHRLLRATREDQAIAQDRSRPALAVEHLGTRDLAVGIRLGLEGDKVAVVGQGEDAVAGQNHLPRSEARLLPFHLTRL